MVSILSLCSGVGALDLAVAAHYGAEVRWVSEHKDSLASSSRECCLPTTGSPCSRSIGQPCLKNADLLWKRLWRLGATVPFFSMALMRHCWLAYSLSSCIF
jgi:hypothetical protein